jgi:hypothetical protein
LNRREDYFYKIEILNNSITIQISIK